MDIKEQAARAVADWRKPRDCTHVLSCRCWQRKRVGAWLAVDALVEQGWTLTPPSEKRRSPQGGKVGP